MMFDRAKDYIRSNKYAIKEYIINDGKEHPVAIICPGGGYSMVCDFVEGAPFAKKLNEMGISAIVVFYRVRKKAVFPNPQDDLAHAVKEAFARAEELKLDMYNYSVWGSSAGGHLAASFGSSNIGYKKYNLPKPAALVLIYPVISMGDETHAETRKNLIGDNPSAEAIEMVSIERQVDADYPDTFIWCGDSDRTVNPVHSHIMTEALERNSIRHCFKEYEGIDHGVGLGGGLCCEGWIDEAVSFWLNR